MAELHYFPMYAAEWLAGEATTLMSCEQEGAFLRLLMHSWLATDVPCSIPSDENKLKIISKLGGRWSKVGQLVLDQFDEVEGYPGRLRNPKLWGVYVQQMEAHSRRVIAGALGGKAKAKRKQSPSIAKAVLQQRSSNALAGHAKQSESESESKAELVTTKATTSDSDESTPQSWVGEGRAWWLTNVGTITYPRFAAALSESVQAHGWPRVFEGIKCYVAEAKAKGKPARVEWCGQEMVRWVDWAGMPATDDDGLLTIRGKAIMGAVS